MRRSDTDLRALRDRFAGLDVAVARAEAAAETEARCVLQAVTLQSEGAYPTVGGLFFSAPPQVVTGTEKEGASPAFAAAAQPIYPYVPGASSPAVGTHAVAALVPYRWALLRGSGANTHFSGVLPGCSGIGVPGTVVVKRTSDNFEILNTTVGSDGAYSGSLNLAANTQFTITCTPDDTTHFTTASVNRTMLAGSSNPNFNGVSAFATPGHWVCSQVCPTPLDITRPVSVVDSTAGSYTLSWETGFVLAFRGIIGGNDVRFQPQTSTFSFGTLTSTPTSHTCGPPFTFVFTQTSGTRTFTVTQS